MTKYRPVNSWDNRFLWWLAGALPASLIYLCMVRVVAAMSVDVFAHREMGSLTAQEILGAWYKLKIEEKQ